MLASGLPSITFRLHATSPVSSQSFTAAHTVYLAKSGAVPAPILPGGSAQSFSPSRGLRVQVLLDQASLCAGQPLEFSWALQPPVLGLDASSLSAQDLVVPMHLLSGVASLNATLTLRYSGSNQSSSATVQLAAAQQLLVPVITGSAGDVYTGDTIRLSAAQSYDPDLPADTTAGLSYSWECISEDYPAPCFVQGATLVVPGRADPSSRLLLSWDAAASAAIWHGTNSWDSEDGLQLLPTDSAGHVAGIWNKLTNTRQLLDTTAGSSFSDAAEVSFPAAALAALDRQYTFRLTVAKGSRVAQAEVVVTPRGQLVAQASLVRRCTTSPCPARHPRSQPLVLELQGDAGVLLTSISVAGHSIGMDAPARAITLRPEVLPAHLDQLVISADLSQSGRADGRTQLAVRLDSPPRCGLQDAACFAVSSNGLPFPDEAFAVTVFGLVDDSPASLEYEIGWKDAGHGLRFPASSGLQHSAVVGDFPTKQSSHIYVCASDHLRQQFCTSLRTSAAAPPSSLKELARLLQGFAVTLPTEATPAQVFGASFRFVSLVKAVAGTNAAAGLDSLSPELQAGIRRNAQSLFRSLGGAVHLDDPELATAAYSNIAEVAAAVKEVLDPETRGTIMDVILQSGCPAASCQPGVLVPRQPAALHCWPCAHLAAALALVRPCRTHSVRTLMAGWPPVPRRSSGRPFQQEHASGWLPGLQAARGWIPGPQPHGCHGRLCRHPGAARGFGHPPAAPAGCTCTAQRALQPQAAAGRGWRRPGPRSPLCQRHQAGAGHPQQPVPRRQHPQRGPGRQRGGLPGGDPAAPGQHQRQGAGGRPRCQGSGARGRQQHRPR